MERRVKKEFDARRNHPLYGAITEPIALLFDTLSPLDSLGVCHSLRAQFVGSVARLTWGNKSKSLEISAMGEGTSADEG